VYTFFMIRSVIILIVIIVRRTFIFLHGYAILWFQSIVVYYKGRPTWFIKCVFKLGNYSNIIKIRHRGTTSHQWWVSDSHNTVQQSIRCARGKVYLYRSRNLQKTRHGPRETRGQRFDRVADDGVIIILYAILWSLQIKTCIESCKC